MCAAEAGARRTQSEGISHEINYNVQCVRFLIIPALRAWQVGPAAIVWMVRGQVEGAEGARVWVELVDSNRGAMLNRTMPGPDGSFECRAVPEGAYAVRVTTLNGDLIRERFENIHSFSDQLTIRIPKRKKLEPVSGLVSFYRLKNPPPPKALRAFAKAQKYADSGKTAEARRSLEEAIRLYPEYTEAYADLGVQLARAGQKEEALASI